MEKDIVGWGAKVSVPPHIAYVRALPKIPSLTLSDSCGPRLSVQELMDITGFNGQDVASISLGYNPLNGSSMLLKALQNLPFYPDDTQFGLFSGAQEALFCIMSCLLQPGDEVLLPSVNYPSLALTPKALGAKVCHFDLDDNFSIEVLLNKISKDTKLLVINSPHNPSGFTFSQADIDTVVDRARGFGCWVIFDDVSAFLDTQCDHTTKLDYDRAVSVNVLSKVFSLPGLRVGWLATQNNWLVRQATAVRGYTSICLSAMDDALAQYALTNWQALIARTQSQIESNQVTLRKALECNSGPFVMPQLSGALVTNLLAPRWNAEQVEGFSRVLANDYNTLLLPLSLFGDNRSGYRLGLGNKDFSQALRQCSNALDHQTLG